MRLRVAISLRRATFIALALLLGASPLVHAEELNPRLGLTPAFAELPDGSVVEVPGPHIVVDGTPFVSSQRQRIFEALQSGPPKASGSNRFYPLDAPTAGFLEVLVNDPSFDSPNLGETQNEPTMVASGDTVVCGFNDSKGLFFTNESVSAFAYSLDGGATWVDGGSVPITGTAGASEMLLGEPALATDEDGRWFYISLYDVGNGVSGRGSGDWGLAVSVGSFTAGVLSWGPPMLFAGGQTPGSDLGLTHAAYDAELDRLYVTYTDFSFPLMGWGQVGLVTLGSKASVVLHDVVVQAEVLQENNGGSQVVVGLNNEVFVAWGSNLLSGFGQGPAFQKIVRSDDGGATFSAPVTAGDVTESWYSNPPGAGRVRANPSFPALAVDTSPGPQQGRVYLAWQDAIEMVFAGALDSLMETNDPNDTPATAQDIPDSLTNVYVSGSLPNGDPADFYRIHGNAGEHLRIITKVTSGLLSQRLRLWCENPVGLEVDTLLAESALGIQEASFAMVTLPYSGSYVIELKRESFDGNYESWFRRTTVTNPSVAIDHRDIVVASSPDGLTNWSTKVRVNDDSEPADQSWPNIAVDAAGVHVTWYDRRFDPRCRALADLVMTSSIDGGSSWTANVRLSSESSWWQESTETIPSYGDHARMGASDGRLHVPWTDGRLGTPDIRSSALSTGVGLVLPDSVLAVEGQGLELEIGVEAGVAEDDTFSVWVTGGCGTVLPDTTWMLTGLQPLTTMTLQYNPFIDDDILTVAPCSMLVDAWSLQTDTHVQRLLPVQADGLIPVALQDFRSSWSAEGVLLQWRSPRTNRFEVQRAASPEGPWSVMQRDVESPTGDEHFTVRDVHAPLETTVWYRLVGIDIDGSRAAFGPYSVSTQAPRWVRLLAPHPNPFNPHTTIPFELPRRTHAQVRILDVRGRQVSTLANGTFEPGRHTLTWNGRTLHGDAAASGVYFAELRAEGRRSYTRLVLVR